MAVDYAAVGASVDDLTFQQRVVGALEAQAIVINAESAGTANHNIRLTLLGKVVNDPKTWAKIFAPVICSVSPISGLASITAATDAQILTGVAAVWDALALRGL